MTKWNKMNDKFIIEDVGGYLLKNISGGMYSNKDVLREYVQNARDSYFQTSDIFEMTKIIITIEENSISILDFGKGMSETEIKQAKKIAVSSKSSKQVAGFRGIGLWAGYEICDKLILETTTKNNNYKYRLTIDFLNLRKNVEKGFHIGELLNENYQIESQEEDKNENYTRCTLENLVPKAFELLDKEFLLNVISNDLPARVNPNWSKSSDLNNILNNFPIYREIPIYLNDIDGNSDETFRYFDENDSLSDIQYEELKYNNIIFGNAWWCINEKRKELSNPGFRLKVHNITVGDVNHYIDSLVKDKQSIGWYLGEIHIDGQIIKPNTPRNDFETSEYLPDFTESLKKFYENRIDHGRFLTTINSDRILLDDTKLFIVNLNSKNGISSQEELNEAIAKNKKIEKRC